MVLNILITFISTYFIAIVNEIFFPIKNFLITGTLKSYSFVLVTSSNSEFF